MKKIFLLLAAVCALVACKPEQENISNGGHISADELKALSTVSLDKAASGANGNCLTCTTSAQVNAKWSINGKDFLGNYAWKKLKKGTTNVILTGLCADGTVVKADYQVTVDEITDPLNKYYIYGEDPVAQPPFRPGAWDAAQMRFSDNEGKHFPYLSDDIYWGFKTLIMDASDAEPGNQMSIMNGWWSAFYAEGIEIKNGPNEIQLTEDMAKDCARGNGGSGKDLQFMFKNGTATINTVYYEE